MSVFGYPSTGAFGAREYNSFTGQGVMSFYPSDLTTTVEPVGLVLNVEQVKQFIVEYNLDSNDLLELIIAGVTSQIEQYLGRDLLTRTRKALFYNVGQIVYLMPVPVASITSVKAQDDEGNLTTLTLNTDYNVRGIQDNVQIYNLNTNGDAILEVTFVTGYGAAPSVPAAIRQAILQETSRQFKRRQDPGIESFNMVNNLSPETYSLLQSYVVRRPT